jgi:hypothetical protein
VTTPSPSSPEIIFAHTCPWPTSVNSPAASSR